ncbi:hypothetical protein D3C84_1106240 [compost metagenome]
MINNFEAFFIVRRAELCFSHRHTDSHSNTLAKWSRRSIYASRVAELWMPWRSGTPLTEGFQIIDR